ncbi:type II toxin-antitoxin system prevent-host-death family antitoxin [Ciceribacter sp. L1K23]|uniref:type II toxin-antitoxin system Phd/YefM family antitoxin n=1 Tax=Ciceribacter sp. L1K23 TaxID=2820276 RepID=UPI001B81430B|nr:type II toxin-antitoxin system prevent-host-death family antitoxin [Ciceribacter sp. L1K23]MBR0554986.1 type II toxin-antitoxin system prevent-host-death family antitoxin [Ciceribacter sp. L1K23]
MTTVNVAHAKARLSELINKAERGEITEIERHGKPVARLVPARRSGEPIDFEWLQTIVDSMPRTEPDTVRKMRDEDRY